MAGRMHVDEVAIEPALLRRLLAAQFPQWAELPIRRVPSAGTDHAVYRLGDERVVRLPRIHWAVGQVEQEGLWLPRLAPHLPLAIPAPLAIGKPGEGYPWHWAIYRWLEGAHPTPSNIDSHRLAAELAAFVGALQRVNATGWPPPAPPAATRGGPLSARDPAVRKALAALHGEIDTAAATAAWEAALQAPAWSGPPVWTHGDLSALNLLVHSGRLSGVIDFGCFGVGDPACDLIVAWNLLTDRTRTRFRTSLGVDDATWARGRGWALSIALIALPYYRETNPELAAIGRHAIAQVLADHRRGG